MPKKKHELDTRVLAVFLMAAAPFIAFGAFVVVNMAKGELRESAGRALEQRAVQTKLSLEGHVGELLVHLRLVALDPRVLGLVAAPPRGGQGPSPLDSAVAERLRHIAQVRPAFKLLQVVGTDGDVRAASGRSTRLHHAESAWFKALAGDDGVGAFVGDVARPSGAQTPVLEVACPVRGPDGAFRGAVRGLVDAADLYAVLGPVRVGRTGHAVLLRSTDGLVLASDESERILRDPLPGWPSLHGAVEGFPLAEQGEALFRSAGHRQGYWRIPEVKTRTPDGKDTVVEPARLVGFTPVDQIPNVQWLVAVEQDLAETMAPVASVTRYLWWHFLGIFTIVILLAVYFSLKVEGPVIAEELHLHEEHLPAAMRPSSS